MHDGVGDGYARRSANIESISVVAELILVSCRVVDSNLVKRHVGASGDRETLHRRVLDVQASDG